MGSTEVNKMPRDGLPPTLESATTPLLYEAGKGEFQAVIRYTVAYNIDGV